jgi:hypothetical protein
MPSSSKLAASVASASCRVVFLADSLATSSKVFLPVEGVGGFLILGAF